MDGASIATFDVSKDGANTKLHLSTAPKKKQIALPVDPSGVTIEIRDAEGAPLLVAELP